MLDVAHAVLVERMADEVELPAPAVLVRDGPAVGSGCAEQIENEVFHYPSLAFAFM